MTASFHGCAEITRYFIRSVGWNDVRLETGTSSY